MKPSSYYRAEARAMLGGNIFGEKWLYALLASFICSAIIGITSSFFVGIILWGPVYAGLAAVFLKIRRTGDKANLEELLWSTKEDRLVRTVILGLLETLFVFLWSLLFVIPGIVKHYSYSMAYYIQQDHPDYDWKQCLDESRRLMNGKKADLFILDLSFIGWLIVGALCCGIGTLWVMPYMEAARAAFYQDLVAEPIVLETEN